MNTLIDLIGLKSCDPYQNKEIVDYLEQRFGLFANQIVRLKNQDSEKESLIIGINCNINNVKAIILSGHIDTVIANEEYSTDPYVATEKDGRLYGLGSVDMKCFFSSIIDNIQEIKQIHMPIIVCISSDEETEQTGVKQIISYLKIQGINPVCTVVGEPTSLKLCTASRSCSICKIKITGKSCHSNNPMNGINAIYIAARLCLFIDKLNKRFKEKGISLSVGTITGGKDFNVVAGNASFEFDLRCSRLKDAKIIDELINKEIKKLERKCVGAKIEYLRYGESQPLEKQNSKIVATLISQLNLEEDTFNADSEAGWFQTEFKTPTFLFGAGDLALAHKPNEHLEINQYDKYNELLISMLKIISTNL